MELSDFDRGRIEGAMAYWTIMARDDQCFVPAVDEVLMLPRGTTLAYLEAKP